MNVTNVFVAMLSRMLRPLVRLLVQQQIQYPLVSQVLKTLYVEVATEDFPIEGKRLTVSRLSLLTGIHRREVKRIQDEGPTDETATPKTITLGAQIVARWTGELPYVDDGGEPRRLARSSEDANEPTFARLVNSVSVDIHPRSVLDEWIRLGVASIDERGAVVLNARAFVPVHGFEEKAHFVGRNLRDHLASACSNLADDRAPFLERAVFYGSLPSEAIDELTALANEVGQQALVRVNERARELQQIAVESGASREYGASRDHGESAENRVGNRRITFGVYLFDAPITEDRDGERNAN